MGVYQTNCYIVQTDSGDIIIDPGYEATNFVVSSVKKPLAALNTHGHFDHIWSNEAVKEALNIPLYCPEGDEFMLSREQIIAECPKSIADYKVKPDESVKIGDNIVKFHHFPGHTPGCSVIEIGDFLFSGDFLFKSSIGRTDFPYSNPNDMVKSLKKFLEFKENKTIYPGHGEATNVFNEQKIAPYWINSLSK